MERMITNRLVWYLEHNKIITPAQCGFRKQRSTSDHLVCLESFVRDAFVQRQHAVAVSFDLEKAYERTWKFGIMNIGGTELPTAFTAQHSVSKVPRFPHLLDTTACNYFHFGYRP